ncbi:unnamed protein product [Closterium sp. NIES-54]
MALPDWDSFTVLAAWLLRERAKEAASPWARYLRSLPAYMPLPALFPQDLIDQFEYWPIVDQHMPTCTISAAATLLPSPMPLPSLLFPTPTLLPPPPFEVPLPQATRLKTAYADLYDRCKSSNPAAIANASRSEFYWALSIVTARSFTFSPSLRARGDGEEQQAEGTDGAERGDDGGLDGADGADGAEVAAEVKEGVATEGAGGEAEEGRFGSSSSSSSSSSSIGGGSDGGGSREEDWYATSAAMLPFADLFNHDFYSNVGWKEWKVRGGWEVSMASSLAYHITYLLLPSPLSLPFPPLPSLLSFPSSPLPPLLSLLSPSPSSVPPLPFPFSRPSSPLPLFCPSSPLPLLLSLLASSQGTTFSSRPTKPSRKESR